LIGTVGEQVKQRGKRFFDLWADQTEAVTVLDVGGMNHQDQRQAEGVDDQMALAPLDLFAGVVPSRTAGFRGFDALAVDHARGWRCRPAGLLAGGGE
jgi:hypothetical protein